MASYPSLQAIIVCVPFLAGCVATSHRIDLPSPAPASQPTATLFVADGAGNYQMLSKSLRETLQRDGQPIEVITCEWSHGKYRSLADHLDQRHARCEGRKLAEQVRAYREQHADRAIHLAGHSAGSTVVLNALERLPANTVSNVLLIAPSVTTEYDLQPAMQSVVGKMHVFYSPMDYIFLGVVTRLLGSPDGRWSATSGRFGFRTLPNDAKLVQHAWQPTDATLGHNGGHFGAYQPEFLRRRVLPLLKD